jgi:hypothetical protein
MNQANQQVVNQQANITLVAIRQAEITYFSSFFSSFGTQCFLLAGILAGSVSQTPAFECATNCVYYWQFIYNICVAISMGLTCMVLLATVFISVFGQGLAIRGPPGSMIQTVHGMVAEQHSIVFLFAWVVVSFQAQFLAMFFIVMEWEWALGCAVLLVIIGYYTYFCSMRIYNRFKWDFSKSGWNYDINPDEEEELEELSPEVLDQIAKMTGGKSVNRSKVQEIYRQTVEKGLLHRNDSVEKKRTVLSGMLKAAAAPPSGGNVNNFEDAAPGSSSPYRMMNDEALPAYGVDEKKSGYLTVKVAATRRASLGINREKWIRYYFVLRGSNLYYYEDRRQFEQNASKPINTRPIDLEGYSLIPEDPVAPFPFSIIPSSSEDIRKTWKFRCDTLSEYEFWIALLKKVIPTANPTNFEEDDD